jgi:Fic family protein
MKLPEIGPTLNDLQVKGSTIPQILASEEANDLLSRANDEYWPWEDFKYKTGKLPFTPEELWIVLKFSRSKSAKKLPLLDATGRPFKYWLPDSTLQELHYIDRSVGGKLLFESIDPLPEAKEQYLISSLMEEAIASSQIEGAGTTRRIAKEMLRTNRKPQNKSEQSIINNYNTILMIKEKLREPMSAELLALFQTTLTMGTLDDPSTAGRFRTDEDAIAVVDQDGQTLHTPPPAAALPQAVQSLCDFANADTSAHFIHPVVRAIILHFGLAYLHPYCDGNGRTARALFYWSMLRQKYWLFEYLSISRIILRSRMQYLRAFLHAERDDCDLTYFVVYHLRAISLAIRELEDYLKRKQKQYREALGFLRNLPWMNYRQRALIQHALKHPEFVYTIESHKTSHNVAYQTARTDLLTLTDKGYLQQIGLGRRFQFIPAVDLPKLVAQGSA